MTEYTQTPLEDQMRLHKAPRGKVLELRARVKLITQQILALGVEA